MSNIEVVGGVIYEPNTNKFIIQQLKNGLWGIPTGKVEDGENIYAALMREMKEELDIDLMDYPNRFLGKIKVRSSMHPGMKYWLHLFMVEYSGEFKNNEPEIFKDVKLMTLNDIYFYKLRVRTALREILNHDVFYNLVKE
jgi:ADP-ribose pyrophosphatase YjhB (NUDIX family)